MAAGDDYIQSEVRRIAAYEERRRLRLALIAMQLKILKVRAGQLPALSLVHCMGCVSWPAACVIGVRVHTIAL